MADVGADPVLVLRLKGRGRPTSELWRHFARDLKRLSRFSEPDRSGTDDPIADLVQCLERYCACGSENFIPPLSLIRSPQAQRAFLGTLPACLHALSWRLCWS